MGTASSVAYVGFALYLVRLWWKTRQTAHSVGDLPGPTTVIAPMTLLSKLLPSIPLINTGVMQELDRGYADFAAAGCDAYAHRNVWPQPGVSLYLADPCMIKEVTTHRSRFPKPVHTAPYQLVAFFGANIVVSEGEDWKRYRKVCAPAFLERNNTLVWDETTRIVLDVIDNVWKRTDVVSVNNVLDLTVPMALYVIGAAGFGRRMSFTEEHSVPDGFSMNFKDALYVVSEGVAIKMAIPKRMLCMTQQFRKVDRAFDELQRHMSHMVDSRRCRTTDVHSDLFSGLLDAADADTGGVRLTSNELFSNMFMFLLAGHETTAHTLAFSLALLALYPDKQEKLYQNVKEVTMDLGRTPAYDDISKLTYPLAVLYETLRFRPPVLSIQKYSEQDTLLKVQNAEGGTTALPVPQGTPINIHVPGLHNNPRYWENPSEFIPERFLADYNKDAFIAFSAGARACIGRRFFETEAIATLSILISYYRVHVQEDASHANETHEERKTRLMRTFFSLTTTPERVPLTFKRR
ncbi:unnamed protein product [Peniophora sp. CBMAI 1063]|nr:unnamed protein product [Peniophora sp. CBMAI 1063]